MTLLRTLTGWTRRIGPVGLIPTVGCLLVLLVFTAIRGLALVQRQSDFDDQAHSIAIALQKSVDGDLDALDTVRHVFTLRPDTRRGEFESMAMEELAHHPSLLALEWAPVVRAADRARMEAAARSDGLVNYQFTEVTPAGLLQPAQSRPAYAPIYYVAPQADNGPVLGFDLLSEPVRATTLDWSVMSGDMAATPRIKLIQTRDKSGLLVVEAVYRTSPPPFDLAQRQAEIIGYAVGVFGFDRLAETSLAGLNRNGIEFTLVDSAAAPAEGSLYASSTELPEAGGLKWATSQNLANRNLILTFFATPAYTSSRPVWQPWAFLALGLAFVVVVTAFLHLYRVRNDQIQRQVQAQTRELSEANNLLKKEAAERRQVEASLRIQAHILENMGEGLAVSDENGRIFLTNPAFDAMFGYERGEIIGQPVWYLDDPENNSPQDITDQIAGELQTAGRWHGEIRNRRKDGRVFTARVRISIVNLDGRRLSVSVREDVTEQNELQDKMVAGQKLAELGSLAAGIAHEINSPLQVITGLSGTLMTRAKQGPIEADRLTKGLETINRNGWRCADIVRSLLTYARSTADNTQPEDLNQLINETLLLIAHQLASWSNITVATELEPGLPALQCNRNQIMQVLINLLTNARDAMPDGGEITVSTRWLADENRLCLQVADTGQGIPEAIRSRIFEAFYTTKPAGKGTGLGLSIITGIMKSLGGEIKLHSRPGHGATFQLFMPVAPAADTTDGDVAVTVPVQPPAVLAESGV